MALRIVLEDFVSSTRSIAAGTVLDDAELDASLLEAAGLTWFPYVAAMDPFVAAWRVQTQANPKVRPSLAALLIVAGFFFGAGSGDVIGPPDSIDNEIALFLGVSGKMLKRSPVLINPATGSITPPPGATFDGRDVGADGAVLDATAAGLVSHVGNTANPHATTAAQVGAPPTARTLTAGDGLIGGGDLSADRTFNVGANPDGSIVVAADSVGVGVLASDAQHGARGGGTQHVAATALANGFMSSADKSKLDGLPSTLPGAGMQTLGAGSVAATTTTRYLVPGYDSGTAPLAPSQIPMTRSGTLRNLFVRHNTPAGNGLNIVYTVRLNGVATALTVTLASTGTQASDTVNSVAYVAGDRIDIEVTKAASIGASPTDVQATLEAA